MAKGTREIRRKIKSTKNTRQITKAMELVSASKMRRAVANTVALRPYARLAQNLLTMLSGKVSSLEGAMGKKKYGENKSADAKGDALHPLLAQREVKKVLVVVVSSDRGLCGGLNTQLFRKLTEYIKLEKNSTTPPELHFVAVGKKSQEFLRRAGQKIVAAYPALSNNPTMRDVFPISKMVLQDYSIATFDKVMLIYTEFISVINQKPTVRRLLPLSKATLEEELHRAATGPGAEPVDDTTEYIFEPSPTEVLNRLLPRLTEMQVFHAILEASASEHSARMFAMRNASDNAAEFIDDLTLSYNQIRQAAITAELAEISAGRAALG